MSPLIDAHLNVHGRYTFTQPTNDGLRPLRDLAEPLEEDYLPDGTPFSAARVEVI